MKFQIVGLTHNQMVANRTCNSNHEVSRQQITCDLTNGSNEVENGQNSDEESGKFLCHWFLSTQT